MRRACAKEFNPLIKRSGMARISRLTLLFMVMILMQIPSEGQGWKTYPVCQEDSAKTPGHAQGADCVRGEGGKRRPDR